MKKLFACLSAACLVMGATAQERTFQASLTPDIAIHPRTTTIVGLTLSVWGENPQRAVAIGFVNGATGQSGGVSFGLVIWRMPMLQHLPYHLL